MVISSLTIFETLQMQSLTKSSPKKCSNWHYSTQLIVSTWSSYSSRPMYKGFTWHILGHLKIRGSEKVWKEMKFWTVSVNFSNFRHKLERHIDTCSGWARYGTCAIIKDLSGYQQSNPVSSVAVPATHPKTEKYLENSHIGLLIAVQYSYFSHFH